MFGMEESLVHFNLPFKWLTLVYVDTQISLPEIPLGFHFGRFQEYYIYMEGKIHIIENYNEHCLFKCFPILVICGAFQSRFGALSYVIHNCGPQPNIMLLNPRMTWKKEIHATKVVFSKGGQPDEKPSWGKIASGTETHPSLCILLFFFLSPSSRRYQK